MTGGAGKDYLLDYGDYGDSSGDTNVLSGGGGNDTIEAFFGQNTLDGGDGNDNIFAYHYETYYGGTPLGGTLNGDFGITNFWPTLTIPSAPSRLTRTRSVRLIEKRSAIAQAVSPERTT